MDGKPLSIAIFSDSALPILNGVSVSIDALIEGLRERGHSVHLFTSGYWNHKDQDPNIHRFFALKTFFARDYPLSLPPFYPMLAQFRQHKFDLIHTHTPFTIGFVGLRWAESHEIPLVTTYHTLYDKYTHYIPLVPNSYLKYKIAKHTNYYYNRVQHVITPSQFSRDWLSSHQIRRPITVIPTGVPEPIVVPLDIARQQLKVRPDRTIALYCGRIAKEKNLGVLIHAMAESMKTNPNLRLWIVGDGPAREEYMLLARDLGIGDKVKFWGFIPREEIGQYYSAADLFVFASRTETQGLVVHEAMSYGLPCVMVGGGGADDTLITGENGLVVPNSIEEFSAAVNRVISDSKFAQRLSVGALTTYRENTISEMVDRVIGVYRSTLSQTEEQEVYVR
ncbi:MAG: glycosyltransferase [Fimbriimonadaceae bacterium]|nr:glycosyltransferase [Fimbriimonadaceae bacterium]